MSRRQSVPSNIFYRRADPNPPLFPEPWEGDIYYNTDRNVLRTFHDGKWIDLNAMRWAGIYDPTDTDRWYYPGDVVREGNWLMICVNQTQDYPAPQETALPVEMLPEGTFSTASSTMAVTLENEWQFKELVGGWLIQMSAKIEESNVGRAHTLSLFLDDRALITNSFIPTDADFYTIPLNPITLGGGAKVRVKLEMEADPNNSWSLSEGLFSPPPSQTDVAQGRISEGAWTDTAYALSVVFTEGTLSPDWTVLANVGATGQETQIPGGGGGDTGILVGFGLVKTPLEEGVFQLSVEEDIFPHIDPEPPTDGRLDFWIDTDDIGQGGTEPPPGGGGGGHTIQDEGANLPQRVNLNFVGDGVTATDAPDSTIITIPGATGGSGHAPDPAGQPDGKHLEVENDQYVFVNRPVVYSVSPPDNPMDGDVWIERTP